MYDTNKRIALFGLGVLAFTTAGMLFCSVIDTRQEAREKFNEAIEANYVAYIDGQEIDINKIDVDNYLVTINEENESLYLTKKGILSWAEAPIKVE